MVALILAVSKQSPHSITNFFPLAEPSGSRFKSSLQIPVAAERFGCFQTEQLDRILSFPWVDAELQRAQPASLNTHYPIAHGAAARLFVPLFAAIRRLAQLWHPIACGLLPTALACSESRFLETASGMC
jgi:hypothetical protein